MSGEGVEPGAVEALPDVRQGDQGEPAVIQVSTSDTIYSVMSHVAQIAIRLIFSYIVLPSWTSFLCWISFSDEIFRFCITDGTGCFCGTSFVSGNYSI